MKCTHLEEHKGSCEDFDSQPQPESEILFIRNRFSRLFGESMNVLELALDNPRLEKVKDLLSNAINRTEHDILIKIQDKLK